MFGFGNKDGKAGRNTNASAMLHVIAGGYVAYMGYELCKGVFNGENPQMYFMVIGVLFILIGGFFCIEGIRSYLNNQKLQKEEEEKQASLAVEDEAIEEIEEIEEEEEE